MLKGRKRDLKEVRIVVADDSAGIREQLRRAFAMVEGCVLVGVASNGMEAVDLVRHHRPDIVVLDIAMPHRSGVQVLREIRKEDTSTVIIMFTADPSVLVKEICLEAGANFYLDKVHVQALLEICQDQLYQKVRKLLP